MDWFRAMVAPEKQVIVTAEAKVGAGKVERITAKLQIMGFNVTTKDV